MIYGLDEIDLKQQHYYLGPRLPYKKLSFLQPVRVKKFVESHVYSCGYSDRPQRALSVYDNENPNKIYYVVGQSHRCQGLLHNSWGSNEDYESAYLEEFSRHFVVKIQCGMNNFMLALLEYIEEIKE